MDLSEGHCCVRVLAISAHPGNAAIPSLHPPRDFALYGLTVRSVLDLPGWPACAGPGVPDVTILREPLATPLVDGPPYSARSLLEDGAIHLGVRGVARYRASGGNEIRVDPDPAARPEDVRLYLTGAMMGTILHQRGSFPLHASCVTIAGKGIALAGPSGAGKSTLVAALLQRGASLVSDDVCVLTPLSSGRFGVWRSAARTRLDADALAALDWPDQQLETAGGNRGKLLVPVDTSADAGDPVALHRVYVLRDGEGEPRTESLEGLEAVTALVEETYFLAYAVALGLASQCFRHAAALASKVEVARLLRPRGFQHLPGVVDLIETETRLA